MNALILRLKNSIDQSILESIDKNLMGQYHFVPISVKDNFLFVAVSKNSNKDEISDVLKKTFQQSIKFMLVGDDDLKELLGCFISTDSIAEVPTGGVVSEASSASNAPTGGGSGSKLGEMLVAKGIVSEVDLMKALAAAKRKSTPIGSTLFEMGLVSLEQLKSVLHDQTGYEMVTAEQLVDQKNFINILPEDFIRANSVIPISSDGKTLVLGVVKPMKMDVMKEIIYLTGQNPKQLLMTHYEFQNSMNTFFSAQKKQTDEILEQITGSFQKAGPGAV
jgi:type IV pilus assembly protein PilB